jgi:hypothetical protein
MAACTLLYALWSHGVVCLKGFRQSDASPPTPLVSRYILDAFEVMERYGVMRFSA